MLSMRCHLEIKYFLQLLFVFFHFYIILLSCILDQNG